MKGYSKMEEQYDFTYDRFGYVELTEANFNHFKQVIDTLALLMQPEYGLCTIEHAKEAVIGMSDDVNRSLPPFARCYVELRELVVLDDEMVVDLEDETVENDGHLDFLVDAVRG